MQKIKSFSLICFFLYFAFGYTFAQSGLPPAYEIKTDTIFSEDIPDTCWQMLEDREGTYTINDVSGASFSDKFHPSSNINYSIHTFWVRFTMKNATNKSEPIVLFQPYSDYVDVYMKKDRGQWNHKRFGRICPKDELDGLKRSYEFPITFHPGEERTLYLRIYINYFYYYSTGRPDKISLSIASTEKIISDYFVTGENDTISGIRNAFLFGVLFFGVFFNLFFFETVRERVYLYFALFLLFFGMYASLDMFQYTGFIRQHPGIYYYTRNLWSPVSLFFLVYFVRYFFHTPRLLPRWDKVLIGIAFLQVTVRFFAIFVGKLLPENIGDAVWEADSLAYYLFVGSLLSTFLVFIKKRESSGRLLVIAACPVILYWMGTSIASHIITSDELDEWKFNWGYSIEVICIAWWVIFFSWILFRRFKLLQKENTRHALDIERLAKEKEIERSRLIAQQKIELERKVIERTAELRKSIKELEETQAQLIQSEKMASLGELTAGIAHEIQNPLNFVNNFSELNTELIDELNEEARIGNLEQVQAIAKDVRDNEEKINHHGKRAADIVKGMLQHSRSSSGQKELTDINKLADEYLRLSYHGLRAKDKTFYAKFETDFDPSIEKINIVSQDIGRVILNLINNAFYAVTEKNKLNMEGYEPTVTVSTRRLNNKVEVMVKDNGNGIPQKVVDKIFQPFFTTKPTGQGTGLGLSLSYDIIKSHGGEIKVETKEGECTKFIVQLPT